MKMKIKHALSVGQHSQVLGNVLDQVLGNVLGQMLDQVLGQLLGQMLDRVLGHDP